ncbi:MAG TPA: outer membrane beta-barrel protein [Polyangia bacterium]|jgi:hypothetical protein
MKRLVRGSLLLAIGALLLTLPSVASAHYTGYPHRHGYYVGPGYGAPPIDRPGVYLGIGGFGDIVANQANSPVDFLTSGAGYNLFLGVRLNPNFALEFGWGQGFHNQQNDYFGNTLDYIALNHLTADLKIIFPNPSNVRPYIQAGLGFYMLTDAFNSDIASGGGFQLGGGLDIYLNPWWSIGGRLLYHGIKFGDLNGTNNAPYLSTVSLEANLQVHF